MRVPALSIASLILVVTLAPGSSASPPAPGFTALEGLHVSIDIVDMLAVTRASFEIDNPANVSVEGKVDLPLPLSAVLTNLTLRTHNQTLIGLVLERNQASANYEASKERGESAALLTSAGKGQLALSVNVAAGSRVLVNVTYAEVLAIDDGRQAYRFPLAALRTTYGVIRDFDLDVALRNSNGWESLTTVGVPTNMVVSAPGHASLHYEAADYAPTQDFQVQLVPNAAGYRSAAVFSSQARNATLLLALMPPGSGESIPLDIVFVLDHSGSMSGDKIVQAKQALREILAQLRPGDRFGLVIFDDVVDKYRDSLLAVNAQNIQNAQAWVGEVAADGSTDLEGGTAAGLAILGSQETASLPTVVLITDGLPTAGITGHARIIESLDHKNALGARIHTVGIGFDQDQALLGQIAASSRGFYQPIGHDEDVNQVLQDFYQRISTPALKGVSLSFENLDVDQVYPDPLPDLYRGSHLVVAGHVDARNLPEELVVLVRGTDASGPVSFTLRIPIDEATLRPEADRLWARQKANSLERYIELNQGVANVTRQRAELLALGLDYQIETQQTSWVLVDLQRILESIPPDERPQSLDAFYDQGGATGDMARYVLATTSTSTQGPLRAPADVGGSGGPAPAATRTPGAGIAATIIAVLAVAFLVARRRD